LEKKKGLEAVSHFIKPLEGVRVLAVEQYIAGPYCSMLLADAGAEVVKLERPPHGDPRRDIGPFVTSDKGEVLSGGFLEYNRSKKSITLDLQKEEGKTIFLKLITSFDVLLVNLRPGSMEKMGLGFEALNELNPRLIYASITGFGEMKGFQGPYWQRPAFDVVAEGMSGVMEMIGFADRPPHYTIFGVPDLVTAVYTAYGIMLALFQRGITGQGQFVESPMYDSMLALNERAVMQYSFTGEPPSRGREKLQGPRGSFLAKDGYLAFSTPTDEIWHRFTKVVGREDLIEDPRCKTGPSRAEHTESFLRSVIEEWLKDKNRDEAVELLLKEGVPAGPVYNMEDIFCCPQAATRKMLIDMNVPGFGNFRLARSPVLLSSSPQIENRLAPTLGQHTEDILSAMGYREKEIKALQEKGII
jgi:CoA:oxalate CoA-transferase